MLSGTLRQFDLRFEYNFSQNALDSLSCVLNATFLKSWRGAAAAKWRDCCFSANQRAPRRRDNFFAIIFFFQEPCVLKGLIIELVRAR